MESQVATLRLSALGHPGRLEIFRRLVRAGPQGMPAGDIARALAAPPSSLSANLKVLSQAGLIAARREGRSIRYAADYAAMTALLEFLMADCCNGEAEVCAPLGVVLTGARGCNPASAERPS